VNILAKDDCFSYYLVQAFDRVGYSANLSCYEEKVPSYIIVDAINGVKADSDVVEPWLANPYCFRKQKELKCLTVTGSDMIIIGSFSDLTIKGYRHREKGWRFFEIRHYIKNTEAVDLECERLDLQSTEEILKNNLILFNYFRRRNSQAVSVWINYPYIDGASTIWADRENPVPNRIIKSRWEELTGATTRIFPEHDIFVLNIPNEEVRERGDTQLWHYHNNTYDYAARIILDWVDGRKES
jgi:hypothetical protein